MNRKQFLSTVVGWIAVNLNGQTAEFPEDGNAFSLSLSLTLTALGEHVVRPIITNVSSKVLKLSAARPEPAYFHFALTRIDFSKNIPVDMTRSWIPRQEPRMAIGRNIRILAPGEALHGGAFNVEEMFLVPGFGDYALTCSADVVIARNELVLINSAPLRLKV